MLFLGCSKNFFQKYIMLKSDMFDYSDGNIDLK